MSSRAIILGASLVLLAAALACRGTPASAGPERPNIVFVLVDDMGWADLGSYGSKAIQTPNLDRMAREGMRFTDAYAGHTVCAPSRCALMTGKHSGHGTVRANAGTAPIRDSDVTIAEVLKRAGYATGGFGKWGLGTMGSEGAAERQGFDTFFGYYHQVHAHTYYPPFLVEDGKPFLLRGNAGIYGLEAQEVSSDLESLQAYKRLSPTGPFVSRKTPAGDYQFSHDLVFERTLDFIREHRDRPFFCYAPWTPPHAAYHLPEDEPAVEAYRDKPWSDRAKVHAAFVSMVDRHVGELLKLLEELGISDRTLVLFMSDNGASNRFEGELDSSGPLRGAKRSMHDGGIRSPLIAHWPGVIGSGVVSDHVTYTPDMMPTLAELAGADEFVPDDVDGLSIAPTLLGHAERQERHEYLYWEWDQRGRQRAVRHGRWKLVSDKPGVWQVFDLETDIAESNDIASKHADLIENADAWIEANRTPPVGRR
ncbi:MAG: arylsulfatase [Bryobacterales bacterium]|nr:arylsulfatase [Bryobacterales bacterium]